MIIKNIHKSWEQLLIRKSEEHLNNWEMTMRTKTHCSIADLPSHPSQ